MVTLTEKDNLPICRPTGLKKKIKKMGGPREGLKEFLLNGSTKNNNIETKKKKKKIAAATTTTTTTKNTLR